MRLPHGGEDIQAGLCQGLDKKHSENQEKKINISSHKSGAGIALEMGAKPEIRSDREEETAGRQNPTGL